MGNKDAKRYAKERNRAFLSLDEKKIRAFCKKYGLPIPNGELAFWAGVHKVVYHTTAATPEQRAASAKWLNENGFSTDIRT